MYQKKTRIYAKKRKKGFLGTAVAMLSISAIVALGGTLYWQKMQLEQEAQKQVQASLDEQVPKETPINKPAPAPEPDTLLDDEQIPPDSQEIGKDSVSMDAQNVPSKDAPQKDAAVPTAPENPEPNKSKITSDALVPTSQRVKNEYFNDAAFVGDSITQGITSYEIMPDAKVIAALGINLDTVYKDDQIRTKDGNKSVLTVLKETAPKKIYIMFGANGVGWFTKEHFSKTYGDFVDKVKEQHPESQIYLQSILPVTKDYTGSDDNINNPKIDEYNLLIVDIAEQKDVHYLDVASAFKDENGALPDDSNGDGMHFSPTYYNKWFDYLKTHTATEE